MKKVVWFIVLVLCSGAVFATGEPEAEIPDPEPASGIEKEEVLWKDLAQRPDMELPVRVLRTIDTVDTDEFLYYRTDLNTVDDVSFVVQDIMGDTRYSDPEFSKGLTRLQKLELGRRVDNRILAIQTLILCNLDIYAYGDTDPQMKIDERYTYDLRNNSTLMDHAVILTFDLQEVRELIDRQFGPPSEEVQKIRETYIGIFYFEPNPGNDLIEAVKTNDFPVLEDPARGNWYPIEALDAIDDIEIERYGNNVTLRIFRWPKDDRGHVGC